MQKHSTLLSITATDRIGSREPIPFLFVFTLKTLDNPSLLFTSFRESVRANPTTITVAEVCFGEAPFVLPNQNHT